MKLEIKFGKFQHSVQNIKAEIGCQRLRWRMRNPTGGWKLVKVCWPCPLNCPRVRCSHALTVVQLRIQSLIRSPMPPLFYPPKHMINYALEKSPPIPKLTLFPEMETGDRMTASASSARTRILRSSQQRKIGKVKFFKAISLIYNRWQSIGCNITMGGAEG